MRAAILILAGAFAACWPAPPPYAPGARPCASDYDCGDPAAWHCAFPAPNTRAQCLPGAAGDDDILSARRPDAGRP